MKKVYTFSRNFVFVFPIVMLIVFGVITYGFITNPNLSILGPGIGAIFIFVMLVIAFFPVIIAYTAKLELENGILSRRYLLIKIWSVAVSDLTDIFTGNRSRKTQLAMIGLSFKDKNGKFHDAPYIITNQQGLIQDLLAINPNIQFHTNPDDLPNPVWRWKGVA